MSDIAPLSPGANAAHIALAVEVRLFNSLARQRRARDRLTLPAGSTVGDVLRHCGVAANEVFLVLCNGRDVTASLHTGPNLDRALDDGDVIALSGPVPYSWGYGSPVV